MTSEELVGEVIALMSAEHGAEGPIFDDLTPYIAAAHATEGTVTREDLFELCCGEESPERRQLEEHYPRLTRIFESVFDGDEPFPLEGANA